MSERVQKYLTFTVEVWGADKDDGMRHKAVTIKEEKCFPYLDMEMYWSNGNEFDQVHLKLNQQLKYLNHGSTHPEACFHAIPLGVMNHLASLMTRTEESEKKRMDKLYPLHTSALGCAKLVQDDFLTLGEILDELMSQNKTMGKKVKKWKNQDNRIILFCVRMSKAWVMPIHVKLKELCDKHGLTWLQFSMSYCKFANLHDISQGNLNWKLMEGIISHDFKDLPCNHNNATKLMGNVSTMASAGQCAWCTKSPAKRVMISTLETLNKR